MLNLVVSRKTARLLKVNFTSPYVLTAYTGGGIYLGIYVGRYVDGELLVLQ
jgi:hypothetical protein